MPRPPKPLPARGARVADQIQRELAELISRELKDPRIGMVTLTGVELTPDYAFANVLFTVLAAPGDDKAVAESLAGLRASAGFLRRELGRRVRIHTTPQLRFVHDPSVERGLALSQLIDHAVSIRGEDDELPSDADAADAADAAARPRG